ncbi:hypothetical protein BP5796_09351 [Coleophoma crateriformis]|uniref:Alpha-1,3-mannosyltransferase CMT1 n=1 Tax=Coleophoma crateriformis TaxID=565419 RepID=A0A3D8QXS6_9HELO|nr:hypothetical protein BP5796_09351 [Coleophoma crateriformis]
MTPKDASFPRLDCPVRNSERYTYLRLNSTVETSSTRRPKYFFALDLHQCVNILPRLLGSIVETMQVLGPENCVLSIVEGRSTDGTYKVLKLLRVEIDKIGATYILTGSELNPSVGDRIKSLAKLRNQAVKPLMEHPEQFSPETTVVFLNDVSICMEDILELVHERVYQNADMTCGLDWTFVGQDPTFYDVWIARGMTGDTFFDIPEDGNWNSAWNLFWNDAQAAQKVRAHRPFQVFACWNGAVAFTAKPLLEHKVRFRHPSEQECFQGEPQLFCKDIWYTGFGKITVIPAISLEYTDAGARRIKDLKGYTSNWVGHEPDGETEEKIEWENNPPALVKCMPSYSSQSWLPWNETL